MISYLVQHSRIDENTDIEVPRYWYNIAPDLPKPLPPPIDPLDADISLINRLRELLPSELIDQEFTFERYIGIPKEVRELYIEIGRPTPLVRAYKLEKSLGTPAKIYYKFEGVLASGSHKLNTAIPQAYYSYREGYSELVTETGAGQWGLALSIAGSLFGVPSTVFMTRSSYISKVKRVELMRKHGATVIPSPSNITRVGRGILEDEPDHPGSLGIAISEAVEWVMEKPESRRYLPGSVMEYVILHQTVIGLEAIEQFRAIDEYPDKIIGCVGGGSNLSGLAYPFYREYVEGRAKLPEIIAVESSLIPKASRGEYRYEHPDAYGALPMIKMYTVGRHYKPPAIKAAGLRFHGLASSLSLLIREGLVRVRAYDPDSVREAAELFYRSEGVLPAPESSHAVLAAIDEALEAKRRGEGITILINLSGHGLYDEDFFRG